MKCFYFFNYTDTVLLMLYCIIVLYMLYCIIDTVWSYHKDYIIITYDDIISEPF